MCGLAAAVSAGLAMYDQGTLPMPAIAAVVMMEALARRGGLTRANLFPLAMTVGLLIVPHLASAVRSAMWERDYGMQLDASPSMRAMRVYYSTGQMPMPWEVRDQQAWTMTRLRAFRSFYSLTDQDKLVILRDGADAIRALPNHRALGMLTPGARLFPFIMMARPVTSFSFWVEAPELRRTTAPLPPDVDLVAVIRARQAEDDPAIAVLLRRAAHDFALCRRTLFWDIYLRRSGRGAAAAAGCDPHPPGRAPPDPIVGEAIAARRLPRGSVSAAGQVPGRPVSGPVVARRPSPS
ncbi:MAG: hypothetical protein EOP68_20460 [Sphingomonas sp.]|nr:MAG: hypothetical protein EOP68_20460 [Sphingomonas sp.]